MNAIERVNALSAEQRQNALDEARKRIAGTEPTHPVEPKLEDFQTDAHAQYPRVVTWTINALALLMLIVAFLPSAMRLHEIGRITFAHAITDAASIALAAACIVLMAEVGQVIFSLAVTTAQSDGQRNALRFGSALCTAIALAGNAEVVRPWAYAGAFVWLETFAPPLLVLIVANVIKTQWLHGIQARHIALGQYNAAHALWKTECERMDNAWRSAIEAADQNAKWMPTVANALREELRNANKRSPAVLRELTDADWRALIHRELAVEQWYERAERTAAEEAARLLALETQQEQERIEVMRLEAERIAQAQTVYEQERIAALNKRSGVLTGETQDAVRFSESGNDWVGTCPHCFKTFRADTEKGAKAALSSHIGRFCKVRNASALASVNGSASAFEGQS